MTTRLERLKTWMEKNGHDAVDLQKALRMPFSLRFALNGGRRIPPSLFFRLRDAFGETAFEEVYGRDDGDEVAKYAAVMTVGNAMYKGTLPRAKEFICQSCGKQAKQYHHPSYRRDSRLCVVPLCAKCHQAHHKSNMPLPHLGIVPRPIGIIRIAIAGL